MIATESIFNGTSKRDLMAYLQRIKRIRPSLDVIAAYHMAERYVRFCKNQAQEVNPEIDLENIWYASLASGTPDYSVYDHDLFVSNLWACWVVYSRKYLLGIRAKIANKLPLIRSVVDLGCGCGYTTAGLKEIFPCATVSGTNLRGTFQFAAATELGCTHGFSVQEQCSGQADFVFASEYFEHIPFPVTHLHDVISTCQPKCLVIANSFGARATGHFDLYEGDINNKKIGRQFNDALRNRGYRALKTGLWNNRPAIWQLAP